MTSPGDIATGVAPSRLNEADWNSDAKMRSFLPLKSSSLRIASFEMTSGLFGEADGNAVQTFVGAEPEIEFQDIRIGGDLLGLRRRLTRPGAASTSKRSSMPTKNSGGMTAAWIAPNWVPSIWRGIVPSWLAG